MMPRPDTRFQTYAEWEEKVNARHSEYQAGNMPEYEYRIDLQKLGFSNDEINHEVIKHSPTTSKRQYPKTGFVTGTPED